MSTRVSAYGWGLAESAAPLDRDGVLRRLDWWLVGAVLALSAIGTMLVWSATHQRMLDQGGDPQAFLRRHLLNVAVGLLLAAVAALVDYRLLRAHAPFVFIASIAGLIAVLSPLGTTINGSHSWIALPGGFSMQPSEFAKLALVVVLAMLLGERHDIEDTPRNSDVILALALAAVPLVLVMLQPDLGTALVVGALVVGVVAVSGARILWVVGLLAGTALAAVVGIQSGFVDDYQVARLTSYLDPSADPSGSGYNVRQAQIAVGSGGLTGQGLFHGYQTQGKFVPEQQTDFVFTVAGEELGLIGAGLIIVLFAVLLWRAGRIAALANNPFGRLIAVGVICWFTFQTFENIGMTLGIMPVTGVPLPFVSYGGSSMFATMMAIGLLCNVHAHRTG